MVSNDLHLPSISPDDDERPEAANPLRRIPHDVQCFASVLLLMPTMLG